jgi:hypothetical protein
MVIGQRQHLIWESRRPLESGVVTGHARPREDILRNHRASEIPDGSEALRVAGFLADCIGDLD